MAVITIVQRALPFALPWRRRSSIGKGKDKEQDIDVYVYTSDRDSHDDLPGRHDAEISGPALHCDVSHALHIAVSPSRDQTTRSESSSNEPSETDSVAESEYGTHSPSHHSASSARAQLDRVVSWASIVRSRCRWTSDQEKELLMAEKQLARCQKAWSSEQELWLAYNNVTYSNALFHPKIEALSEEKAAHEGFMLMRTRQQEEERHQFRKAWKRRRFAKLRRLQRVAHYAPALATTESPALTCQG
ncbi:uncharacterized protein N7482_000476 [Penicillium canariense]|uniref:Uncharacterized protein n=1 Tax=Penicillium canariense TaxID=189055 RepID=A0A9W9IE89_9EURO|nr:uncharacterized protein N7482_000476 [Penicillium canariense]KAJ5174599.1 hypothetical protein N7482_000476 [Penicillium canariense]